MESLNHRRQRGPRHQRYLPRTDMSLQYLLTSTLSILLPLELAIAIVSYTSRSPGKRTRFAIVDYSRSKRPPQKTRETYTDTGVTMAILVLGRTWAFDPSQRVWSVGICLELTVDGNDSGGKCLLDIWLEFTVFTVKVGTVGFEGSGSQKRDMAKGRRGAWSLVEGFKDGGEWGSETQDRLCGECGLLVAQG